MIASTTGLVKCAAISCVSEYVSVGELPSDLAMNICALAAMPTPSGHVASGWAGMIVSLQRVQTARTPGSEWRRSDNMAAEGDRARSNRVIPTCAKIGRHSVETTDELVRHIFDETSHWLTL